MEDTLIALLGTFNYPVFRQGSLEENAAYPNTFFTYWCNEELEQSAYDNQTQSVTYNFDVNVYSNNVQTVYDLLKNARTLLKQNGFIILTRGYDVASDEITHTGRGMNVCYLNREN